MNGISMCVGLHYSVRGEGPPVLLLHGLFGMGDNLSVIDKALSKQYRVYSLDLRNHGRSGWAASMSLEEMAEDVLAFMDQRGLESVIILGHSLGGKVAMQLAQRQPQRVERLVVADIAPVEYPPHHNQVLEALQQLELTAIKSRREADELLAVYINEKAIRQFLLKSLYKDNGYQWRFNLDAICSCYDDLRQAVTGKGFEKPCLFIKGGQSGYIRQEHQAQIATLFPNFSFKIIESAGHWLHSEKPAAFNRIVERFLIS